MGVMDGRAVMRDERIRCRLSEFMFFSVNSKRMDDLWRCGGSDGVGAGRFGLGRL